MENHWLNTKSREDLTSFISKQAKRSINDLWLDDLITFIENFPEPPLVISRLDNFWNLLIFDAKSRQDEKFVQRFIAFLKQYQQTHQKIDFSAKLSLFQSALPINK